MILRPYQQDFVHRVIDALEKNPVAVMATGGGKTACAVAIQQQVRARVLFVAHRRELIGQAHNAFLRAGSDSGIIMAGHHGSPSSPIQIASVQTLARRDLPPCDAVFIDECHHATKTGQYARLFGAGVPVVGFTATPFRLDGRGLGEVGFRAIVVGAQTADLVPEHLVNHVVYAPKAPDLRSVRIVAGDYKADALGDAMSAPRIVGDVVQTWRKRALGLKTVCFAVNIKHSLILRDAFRSNGVRAEHLDGSTPKDERARVLGLLKDHAIDVLTNCNIVTEGWDLPSLEACIVARPTKSLCLHIQMIGRVLRAHEGKRDALVLDHAGNYHEHGLVTDRLTYSLDGRVRKAGTGESPVKTCPACFAVIPLGCTSCPECGCEMARALPEAVDGELEQVASTAQPVTFDDKCRDWRAFHRIGVAKGRPFVAEKMYQRRHGSWPTYVGSRLIGPENYVERLDLPNLRLFWDSKAEGIAKAKSWTEAQKAAFRAGIERDFLASVVRVTSKGGA